jgi:hypothetical protein
VQLWRDGPAWLSATGLDRQRRRHLEQALSRVSPILVRRVATGIVVLLALAVVASATGYLGASRILRNGVLGSLGPALFLMVAVRLLYGLTLALIQTRAARSLRIVRLQLNSVHRSVERVLSGWTGWPGRHAGGPRSGGSNHAARRRPS